MSNVVSIGLPRRPNKAQRQACLLTGFANHRRDRDDVYWLKENAEVLNVLATSGAELPPQALEIYQPFYATIEERLRFFPQYYRFLLSMCLDLEDLGMSGGKGEALCRQVDQMQLAAAELSDLQRAESERLIARRLPTQRDHSLNSRLRQFIGHSGTFALPNKKAAYELTHIVFYLSEYGSTAPELETAAITSLEYTGLLAYLDQDVDLLAEVCVALRFAGVQPSEIWEDWLSHEMLRFVIRPAVEGRPSDAYHEYLVTSWWAEQAGMDGFNGTPVTGAMEFVRRDALRGPLRTISELLYHLGSARTGDWPVMRSFLEDKLEAHQHSILTGAEQSSEHFGAFFEQFSRVQGLV